MSTVEQPKPMPVWRTAASTTTIVASYLAWGILVVWLAITEQWWTGSAQDFVANHTGTLFAFAIWPWFYAVTLTQLPQFLQKKPYISLYGRANRWLSNDHAYWYGGISYLIFFVGGTVLALAVIIRGIFGS